MLDVTQCLPTQSSSATAEVNALPFSAFGFDSQLTDELALTEPTIKITGAVRRLHVALEARFIALVLSDDNHIRTNFLVQLTQSLSADEYRILPIIVPPTATRKQLTSLMAKNANPVETEKGRSTCSPLPSAYDLGQRFEADVLKSYAEGRRTLLIFDDAHLLTSTGLHFIHALSNITAEYDLAVPLILAAGTSFAARLRRPAWRALASRTGAVVRL